MVQFVLVGCVGVSVYRSRPEATRPTGTPEARGLIKDDHLRGDTTSTLRELF